MSKNIIPEIAKLLGVELGEEFELKDKQDNCVSTEIYKFSEDSLLYRYRAQNDYYTALSQTLYPLFRGDYEVIKLPWRPEKGDTYYSFEAFGGTWVVALYSWSGRSPIEYALLDKDWIYRTKAEAEAALPKVAKELGVEYEI